MNLNINESQATEFKQPWKDDYIKTVNAFANSSGVKLFDEEI